MRGLEAVGATSTALVGVFTVADTKTIQRAYL